MFNEVVVSDGEEEDGDEEREESEPPGFIADLLAEGDEIEVTPALERGVGKVAVLGEIMGDAGGGEDSPVGEDVERGEGGEEKGALAEAEEPTEPRAERPPSEEEGEEEG